MKKLNNIKYLVLFIATNLLLWNQSVIAQEDTVAPEPVIKLHYFNNNNSMQYVVLESGLKKNKVITPQKNKVYELYLDSSSTENLLGKLTTDDKGKAKTFLPPAVKASWDAAAQHTFIVKEADKELITDYLITKSKLEIDTSSADGVKSITATVMKMENGEWVPAPDVEMKLGIKRLGGILSAGDEATYTTDSSGTVTVEVTKDSLPGDTKGNVILAARVEDNEFFGNIQVEKTVPWGTVTKTDNSFFAKRTLWTTRNRTPYWLLFMAYSIVLSVWGTLLYLLFQFIKIKKLGRTTVKHS